jgi:hypothetical protein
MVTLLLLGLAFVCFVIGVIDHPRISGSPMIAAGLMLTALAQLVALGMK